MGGGEIELTATRALVLGGGGGFGLVQAAYMQAAYELGFRPDFIIGTCCNGIQVWTSNSGDASALPQSA